MQDLKIGDWRPIPGVNQQIQKTGHRADFATAVKNVINDVSRSENQADKSVMDLLTGKKDINESMIAMQKFDLTMRLLLTVRNKAIEAYKEIMHMQF